MGSQLRVRLPSDQRKFLEQLAERRGRGENVSDIVRMMISDASENKSAAPSLAIGLSQNAHEIITGLAKELDRKPNEIIEACVRGVKDIIEGDDRPPLIAEEVRLRRRYQTKPAKERSGKRSVSNPL